MKLNPTITYPLSDLWAFAVAMQSSHTATPRNAYEGGLRASMEAADSFILKKLAEFRDANVEVVQAAHLIPQMDQGHVDHTLYMQLKRDQIRPL